MRKYGEIDKNRKDIYFDHVKIILYFFKKIEISSFFKTVG